MHGQAFIRIKLIQRPAELLKLFIHFHPLIRRKVSGAMNGLRTGRLHGLALVPGSAQR